MDSEAFNNIVQKAFDFAAKVEELWKLVVIKDTTIRKQELQIQQLQKDIQDEKDHSNWVAGELCELTDWLIGNKQEIKNFTKEGYISDSELLKERIRDLVAKEAELEELKENSININYVENGK